MQAGHVRGGALCWSQRKPQDGLGGFLVLFWANLDSLGALGKPLPVVQASFRGGRGHAASKVQEGEI